MLNSQSNVFLLSFFVDFFNLKYGKSCSSSEYRNKKQKHFEEHEDHGQKFLLILDNCQDLIENDTKKFKTLLKELCDGC